MITAILDENGIVIDTIVVKKLKPGAVECPSHVGIGMHIDTPPPPIIEPAQTSTLETNIGVTTLGDGNYQPEPIPTGA